MPKIASAWLPRWLRQHNDVQLTELIFLGFAAVVIFAVPVVLFLIAMAMLFTSPG